MEKTTKRVAQGFVYSFTEDGVEQFVSPFSYTDDLCLSSYRGNAIIFVDRVDKSAMATKLGADLSVITEYFVRREETITVTQEWITVQ